MTDNAKLIAEAQSFLGGSGQATLVGRLTKALKQLEAENEENAADSIRYSGIAEREYDRAQRLARELEAESGRANDEHLARMRAERRAEEAWEVIRSNYWYNHYDELNEAHTAQREAVEAILDPDWTPDFDTSNSTKYVGWLDYQRIRALRKLFFEDKLREGLRQSAAGEVHDLGSFAQHADEEE